VTAAEPDAALRHFQRDSIVACGVLALGALAATRGRLDVAAGVVAGGALMAVSFRAIKGGVDVVVAGARAAGERQASQPAPEGDTGEAEGRAASAPRPLSHGRMAVLAVKFFTRYALLAVGAYVMLTCFRLHPVGLLVGAMSPFAAAVVQVVRMSRTPARRDHP